MADIVSRRKRSYIMSRIRGAGNLRTEATLARLLRQHGIKGWRRGQRLSAPTLPGKLKKSVRPDFVFKAQRVALFVDGCFWHGCPRCYRRPASNKAYWTNKIVQNLSRDREQTRALKKQGWRVVRIWEHELARKRNGRVPFRLLQAVQQGGRDSTE